MINSSLFGWLSDLIIGWLLFSVLKIGRREVSSALFLLFTCACIVSIIFDSRSLWRPNFTTFWEGYLCKKGDNRAYKSVYLNTLLWAGKEEIPKGSTVSYLRSWCHLSSPTSRTSPGEHVDVLRWGEDPSVNLTITKSYLGKNCKADLWIFT